MHNQVNGSMSSFRTAALDPVFWMHHCNVDRLWETYAHDLGHDYPFRSIAGPGGPEQQSWTKQEFPFLRPDGNVKIWTSPQLLDVPALGYKYDTTAAPPLPAVQPAPPPGSQIEPFGVAATSPPQPMASVRDVPLAGTTQAQETATPGAGPLLAGAFPPETRWTLRLTGIRASRPAPTSYEVYLADPDHYVGLLSLFGVYEASVDNGSSAAAGEMRLLDGTAQMAALGPSFDVGTATVRLVPVNPDRDLAGAQMSIEQITLEAAS